MRRQGRDLANKIAIEMYVVIGEERGQPPLGLMR